MKSILSEISSEFNQYKSPISLSTGTDDSNGSTDEDIIKLAKDLTNTFGILLGDSDQPPQFSDVIFRVRNRRFFASKILLVSRSEYFKAMFTGSMKESSIKEVTLEGVDPEVFLVVLKYICIGILELDDDHLKVGSIYQYCDLLGLNRGKELSLGMMTKIANAYIQKPDVENALSLWDSINRNLINCEDVHPHLRAFCLQYASLCLHSDQFLNVCEKTVIDMLRNDGLRMDELDILDCVIEWCKCNNQKQQQDQQNQLSSSTTGSQHGSSVKGGSLYGTLNKRNSQSYLDRKKNDDAESHGSCSSSRCSSRRNSIGHEKETGDLNRSDSHSDGTEESSFYDDDDEDDDDFEDEEFTDDDDKEDSANDDIYYSSEPDTSQNDEWDKTMDKNLLNKILPLIRWENMNIGEAFERLENLKLIPDKEITSLLRGILKSNKGEPFQFLGYHYKRPRNLRKRSYPIEFLLGMTQPFESNNGITNELIPLNSFSSEYGQSTNQFLYRIKKDIKLPANLERFKFKDREFFIQLKEREKGQLAVYLAFGNKITKPLAISVLVSIVGFRFQDSIEFSYKKLFEEGFDSAWGWPRFISLETLQKDKYTHYSDSFCILLELTSQWG